MYIYIFCYMYTYAYAYKEKYIQIFRSEDDAARRR